MKKDKVYISINKKANIDPSNKLLLKDVGNVYCIDEKVKKSIENIVLEQHRNEEDWEYLDVTKIIKKVVEKYPSLEYEFLGEVETLIEYKSQEKKRPVLDYLKITVVCIILFFGASLAIMNFHMDVNAKDSMEKVYYTLTGNTSEVPLIMTIPYSIGVGAGVLTFFTRIFSSSKRRKKEPSPMEIELFSFDQMMEQQILNESRKEDNTQ